MSELSTTERGSTPVVCFDEKPVVPHADVRPTLPVAPGVPERIDCEYERKGTANLFFLVEPLRGWRQVSVTAQRTKQDYAQQMRWLVDVAYPKAEYVRVVQDNLNTHTPGRSMKRLRPKRRGGFCAACSSITPRSMPVG